MFFSNSVFLLPLSCTGDCREGAKSKHWRFGQKEVLGTVRLDRWPILFPDPQTYSSASRGCPVLFRQQRDTANVRHNGFPLPGKFAFFQTRFFFKTKILSPIGTSRRRLFPVHCLFGRECLRATKVKKKYNLKYTILKTQEAALTHTHTRSHWKRDTTNKPHTGNDGFNCPKDFFFFADFHIGLCEC